MVPSISEPGCQRPYPSTSKNIECMIREIKVSCSGYEDSETKGDVRNGEVVRWTAFRACRSSSFATRIPVGVSR